MSAALVTNWIFEINMYMSVKMAKNGLAAGLIVAFGVLSVMAGTPVKVLLWGDRMISGNTMTRPDVNALPVQLQALCGEDFSITSCRVDAGSEATQGNQNVIFLIPDWINLLEKVTGGIGDTLDWYNTWITDLQGLLKVNPHSRYFLALPSRSISPEFAYADSSCQATLRPRFYKLAQQMRWETIDLQLVLASYPEYWQDGIHISSIGAGTIAKRFYQALHQDRFQVLGLSGTDDQTSAFDYHGYAGVEGHHQGHTWRVVLPTYAAAGHPWIWRQRFWGHEPQTEIALLERGYYVIYCDAAEWYGNTTNMQLWDWFYDWLQSVGFAPKGILEGFSRGGIYAYRWLLHRPESVAGVYADAPVLDMKSWPGGKGTSAGSAQDWAIFKKDFGLEDEQSAILFEGNPLDLADSIAWQNVPMLHVVGEADRVVPVAENTDLFVARIRAAGGTIRVIRKPGVDHHPHSLQNPTPIVDFIEACYGTKVNWASLPAPGNEYRSAAGWQSGMEWHSLFTEMNALPAISDTVDMLLFGNSITQSIGGPGRSVAYRPGEAAFSETFQDWKWYNFGISGDRTQHLRRRVRQGTWQMLHPKYIVITIGVNNIPSDQAEEIFQGITGIVQDIRAKDQHVKVLVVGPLPTKDPSSENRRTFDEVHRRLAAYPFPSQVTYSPLAYQLLDANGNLPENYFGKDGIHLLPEGYVNYARVLLIALDQMR